jgi:hypothetical protein
MALKSLVSGDPTKPYLGMSKQDVLACAGQPHSDYESGGGGETMTYHYGGAGPVPGEAKKADDKKKDDDKQKPKGGLLGRGQEGRRQVDLHGELRVRGRSSGQDQLRPSGRGQPLRLSGRQERGGAGEERGQGTRGGPDLHIFAAALPEGMTARAQALF